MATPLGQGPGLLLPQSSLMSKKAKNGLSVFTVVRIRGPGVKGVEYHTADQSYQANQQGPALSEGLRDDCPASLPASGGCQQS